MPAATAAFYSYSRGLQGGSGSGGPTVERLASLHCLGAAELRALFLGESDYLLARIAGKPPDPVVFPFRSERSL